jgi:hypothetical protein
MEFVCLFAGQLSTSKALRRIELLQYGLKTEICNTTILPVGVCIR